MADPITKALENYPRAGLTLEPTPLSSLPRLSEHLGQSVHILREDLTGFGLGGNKIRKLDYLIGDAVSKQAKLLVAEGACSFTRNAALAGKALGLEMHLAMPGSEQQHNPASRAIFEKTDSHLYYGATFDEVAGSLRNAGQQVYELVPGGSNEIGALGYVRAFQQVASQSRERGIHFDHMVVSTGSTATQVGLLIGQMLSGYKTIVTGMAISQTADVQRGRVLELAKSTAEMLNLSFDSTLLRVDDGFLGEGYARPSEAGAKAAQLFAQLEGILLDPVYTGKTAAGLIHHVTTGLVDSSENVLFIHTGGNGGVYD